MSGVLNHSASDVYPSELNLSQVIRNIAVTIGASVGASNRGPLGKFSVTSKDEFKFFYGPSDPSVSMMHACVQDFLDQGSQCVINRVVAGAFGFSGAMIQNFGSPGSRVFRILGMGSSGYVNPADGVLWATAGGVSDANENLAYVYAIGPGSYYDNYAIDIQSDNIVAPSGVAVTQVLTGGTLTSGSYQYQVSAIGKNGETLASTAVSTTFSGGVTTGAVNVSWNPVPGALGYRIYGRASGLVGFIGSTPSTDTAFLDRGTVALSAAVPNTAPALSKTFTLRVFDNSISLTNPMEAHVVSFEGSQDGYGNQTDLETVVNSNSRMIRVVSNYPNMTQALPTLVNLAKVSMTGGANGSVVTDSEIVAGYQTLSDKDEVQLSVLINSGYATPGVHSAMIALCEQRKDCIAILDSPSTQQQVQNLVAYRKIALNANTSRATMVAPDYERIDTDSRRKIWCPLSGVIAGRMAYTDTVANAGTSAAGLNRGIIPNAIRLRHRYDGGQRDQLASAQISYARSSLGDGTYWAEQLTLTTLDSAMSYVSVRRIFDIMETAMTRANRYMLHENNTAFTGIRIANMLSTYLEALKRAQVILNYAVIIDNSPETRGRGQVGIKVAIEPVLPINQITLETIITRQGEISFYES